MARIFITGSTEGLGRAAAQSLLDDGQEVVLHARSTERTSSLADLAPQAAGVVIGDLRSATETRHLAEQVNAIGRGRIVLAGLWTSVCIVDPALSAVEQGFEVYVIADACGDMTHEAHERAVARMIQVGARPMTSMQYLLELQRDWARAETYDATTGIARAFGGSYGLGVVYAKTMIGSGEGH